MKLFDVLNLYMKELKPEECKLHLAGWNGFENPLDVFLAGDFEEWQSWQTKKNFERPYIVSLVNIPGKDRWLLVGVYKSFGCRYDDKEKCYKYHTEEVTDFSDSVGRLIVTYRRTSRQSYLNAESWESKVLVSEMMAERMVVEEFKGYGNVLINKKKLDIIVNQSIESWRVALSNMYGIYLITDTSNGKHYVGSASGGVGIWQRWYDYSHTGHGGNKELRKVLKENGTEYSQNFQYSILEIFDVNTSAERVLEREGFWKDVLKSREFGYNGN